MREQKINKNSVLGNQSPEAREFYEFLKTMETYETTLSEQDTLILSTDSDFFRFMKQSNPNKA